MISNKIIENGLESIKSDTSQDLYCKTLSELNELNNKLNRY